MQVMDLDDFKFDEVIPKNIVVLNILITYIEEGVFDWPNLINDLFNHFECDSKWARVRKAPKREEDSNI